MSVKTEKSRVLKVLVIDDSEVDRDIVKQLLDGHDSMPLDVCEAESGSDGLSAMRTHRPDCILLDYSLGDMTGVDFLRRLRSADGGLPLPVLLLTSHGMGPVVESAMLSGVADYVSKNAISGTGLVRAITNAVEKHELRQSLQRATSRMEAANAELMRRNDEIQSFYHTLSHEMKTPLTVIHEFLSLALEGIAGPVEGDLREYIEIARTNCARLTTHVNDILDVTRVETGKFALTMRTGDLAEVVSTVVRSFAPESDQRSIQLSFTSGRDLPTCRFDELRIVQVVTNLITNALKFSSAGGSIEVIVDRIDDEGEVALIVKDTGCGIPEEALSRLFDRLFQVREPENSRCGLGLGLFISRQIIEQMGGNISVASRVGLGTTFTVRLPACQTDAVVPV